MAFEDPTDDLKLTVRSQQEFDEDSRKFDSLCAIFAEAARPYIKDALLRQEEERQNLLKQGARLQEMQSLVNAVAGLLHLQAPDLSASEEISEAEISEEAFMFAEDAVHGWLSELSIMADSAPSGSLDLNDSLQMEGALPCVKEARETNTAYYQSHYGLAGGKDLSDIMRSFAHRLMQTNDSVDLGEDMKLEKGAVSGNYRIKKVGKAP